MENIQECIRSFYCLYDSLIRAEIEILLLDYFERGQAKYEKLFSLIERVENNPKKRLIMQKLLKIPRGQTITYANFAKFIGLEKQTRNIATLIGKNPLPVIIPCHRVVRKDCTGNYIFGEKAKEFLINFEKPCIE